MNKKKTIIVIIVSIILIAGITITILLLNNKKEVSKETIILKDNLEVEINSEVNLLSFISDDNKVKIVSEDETIDTSTLGEKEITIKYLDKDKEEEFTFKIEVIDTQAPTIEYKKELSTTEGAEIDLLKEVKVEDNSKEKIEVKVDGEYDFNKVGTYNLKYVAEDSSKNKKEEEFTLTITEKPKQTTKSNTTKQPQKSTNNNSNNTSNNTDSGKTFEQAYAESQVYVDYAVQLLNANLNRYSTSPMSYDNKYPGKVELIMRDANFWWECDEYGLWSFRSDSQTSKKDPKSTTFAKMMAETPKPSTCNPGEKSQVYHYYFFNSYVVSY